MGGKAFATHNPPLPTPRMPPPVYLTVRDGVMNSLSKVFAHVTSPLPLPQKPSHGDIDIMVCDPLPTYTLLAKSLASPSTPRAALKNGQSPIVITPAFLQDHLHATAHINNGAQSKTYAIPYPELQDTYIQVDIAILPSLGALEWFCTLHSYGALFTLIGSIMCKPNGLTLNDKGLFLRIPEIEKHDRKRGSVLLSADWDIVMRTLGLDAQAFRGGFENVTDVWAWIVAARLFAREDVGCKGRDAQKRKGGNGEMWENFEAWLVERDRRLGVARSEGEPEEDEDERQAWRERKKSATFEAMVEKFGVGKEIDDRLVRWRAERQVIEEKRVRKSARREAFEEDDMYGNAWRYWLVDTKALSD